MNFTDIHMIDNVAFISSGVIGREELLDCPSCFDGWQNGLRLGYKLGNFNSAILPHLFLFQLIKLQSLCELITPI
jgi:hypothetical protein